MLYGLIYAILLAYIVIGTILYFGLLLLFGWVNGFTVALYILVVLAVLLSPLNHDKSGR